MKHFIAGLFLGPLVLVALLASLLLSGCSRGSSAPATDTTGATQTGQTLTLRITGNTPTAFLSFKRGDAMPTNTNIKLPYEQTFNVRGSDRFDFASGVENAAKTQTKHDVTIELLLDGKSVVTAKEGAEIPFITHAIYTVPER